MATEPEMVTLEEAKEQVRRVSRRLGLLHIAFARTIVDELGEEPGKKLILKAIKAYSANIGEKAKGMALAEGLELIPQNFKSNLPMYGVHERKESLIVEGEPHIQTYGCEMGKVWRDLNEGELGQLYCYMDVFKYMAFNPEYKQCHEKLICPDGYCELVVRKTTEQERHDFASEDADLEYIDYHL